MADNRIYLRCKCCGRQLFIGKRFGNGYFYENYFESTLSERLNNFFASHTWCEGQIGDGLDCFEINYEFSPEFDYRTDWET